jgi:hypothetical protein
MPFLGAFAKLRKATINRVMFFRMSLSVRPTDFREICYFIAFRKPVEKIEVPLISDKKNGYST